MRALAAAFCFLLGCAQGSNGVDSGSNPDGGASDGGRSDAGSCVTGAACTGPADCCGDLDCVETRCCARASSACGGSGDCCAPLACIGGSCAPEVPTCGQAGQACCAAPTECMGGLSCVGGQCRASTCGGEEQPCCAGDACDSSLSCSGGRCIMLDPQCSFTTCGTCTGPAGCGWCESSGRCMAGNTAGPSGTTCADWIWASDHCPEACTVRTSCSSCTSLFACGWCAETASCTRGTLGGPITGSCGDWVGDFDNCVCSAVQGDCTTPGTECCNSLSCRRGVTFTTRCCAEAGQSCASGADCCGAMGCNATTDTCVCRAAGSSCVETSDCCTGSCISGFCG